jgi:hypothetical protein
MMKRRRSMPEHHFYCLDCQTEWTLNTETAAEAKAVMRSFGWTRQKGRTGLWRCSLHGSRSVTPGGSRSDKKLLFLMTWEIFTQEDPPEDRRQWKEEHRFHPERLWRFDYALPDLKIAVEVDGGQFVAYGGRHSSDADREKHNHACALDWLVYHFSPQQLVTDPLGCIELVRQGIRSRADQEERYSELQRMFDAQN